ncbi:hypothetical protein DFH06DRAFT_1206215 [Mycena polygramma]|nr:hypothetical protein DFH06DRAFT_1206215 [Mycena polygramma]
MTQKLLMRRRVTFNSYQALIVLSNQLASSSISNIPDSPSITMADEQMEPIDYDSHLLAPHSDNTLVKGWSARLIAMNHRDEVVKVLEEQPDKCLAAVILTSDFHDRSSGPSAIKAVLMASQIPGAQDIDVFPPIPKEEVPAIRGPSMPWTNIVFNCSDEFKAAVLGHGAFYAAHNDVPISFYFLDVRPPSPRIYLTYTGLVDFATVINILDGLYAALLADADFCEMVRANHENIPNNDTPSFILGVALHFAHISTCTVRKRLGRFNYSPPITAHRISIPPISSDEAVNARLQARLMSPAFSFAVPLRGVAVPWLGPDPNFPQLMSCSECHSVDHYNDECPMTHCTAYRRAHNLPEPDTSSSSYVPNSLTLDTSGSNTAPGWTTVRGSGRGRAFRSRGGGGRPFRGAGRGFGVGSAGYKPYSY